MKAVILAGGFGTRLRRVAFDIPKPMVPILRMPFIEYQMRLLKENGIKDIVLCVHYMADKIKSYFGDGKRVGISITYSEEDVPLGTAGAIKKAEKYLDDVFIVLNGDSYINIDLPKFIKFHNDKKSLCTIALIKSNEFKNYGAAILDEEKKVKRFLEDASMDRQASHSAENTEEQLHNNISSSGREFGGEGSNINQAMCNSGFYIFDKKILSFIPSEKNFSLEKDVFPRISEQGMFYGYEHDGYFMDISRPESYSKFKQNALGALMLNEIQPIREAMKKISSNGIDIVLISNQNNILQGVINDRIIKEFILKGGSIDSPLSRVMVRDPITARANEDNKIEQMLDSGIRYLPILDEYGRVHSVEVKSEKLKSSGFPVLRGRAPMRISFAGGGTDLPYFFDKHGGAVISASIDKYCSATLIKRADNKIIIDSDATPSIDVYVNSINNLKYDGNLDLIKAIINLIQPDFGFELYIHNDVPPGRGLGASASVSVLISKMLAKLTESNYDDYALAELAYKAEREELKIKGGWQDQYSAVIGGFNFMEFNQDKTLVYPLRLKDEFIKELNHHLLLCYVGKSHSSGEVHKSWEISFKQNEEEKIKMLNKLKNIALEMKDALLTEHLEDFGRLLRDSWEYKRSISKEISNSTIDRLYEIGIQNGAYGGKLLGAGHGGYILFFYSPRKRNQLGRALESAGGEILNFSFEFKGADIWQGKNRF